MYTYLREGHFGDDCKHNLLALGRVRVLDVFVQPRLERARRLASGVLSTRIQTHVTVHIIRILILAPVNTTALGTVSVVNRSSFLFAGGSVVQWLRRWTCDSMVASSIPVAAASTTAWVIVFVQANHLHIIHPAT